MSLFLFLEHLSKTNFASFSNFINISIDDVIEFIENNPVIVLILLICTFIGTIISFIITFYKLILKIRKNRGGKKVISKINLFSQEIYHIFKEKYSNRIKKNVQFTYKIGDVYKIYKTAKGWNIYFPIDKTNLKEGRISTSETTIIFNEIFIKTFTTITNQTRLLEDIIKYRVRIDVLETAINKISEENRIYCRDLLENLNREYRAKFPLEIREIVDDKENFQKIIEEVETSQINLDDYKLIKNGKEEDLIEGKITEIFNELSKEEELPTASEVLLEKRKPEERLIDDINRTKECGIKNSDHPIKDIVINVENNKLKHWEGLINEEREYILKETKSEKIEIKSELNLKDELLEFMLAGKDINIFFNIPEDINALPDIRNIIYILNEKSVDDRINTLENLRKGSIYELFVGGKSIEIIKEIIGFKIDNTLFSFFEDGMICLLIQE